MIKIVQPSIEDLPRDARTLLRTLRNVEIKKLVEGEYYYFGLEFWLQSLVGLCRGTVNSLAVHVNIDSIPLFSSANTCLWPVLCSAKEFGTTVFPVDVYCSNGKPESVRDYLRDFIDEVKVLEQSGYTDDSGKNYRVKLEAVICDAPAHAFVKYIKGLTAYDSCERCMQHGEWCGKVVLSNLKAPLRTDGRFSSQQDEAHHTGTSPFCDLQCGIISSFPLDYTHSVSLGVARRLINL